MRDELDLAQLQAATLSVRNRTSALNNVFALNSTSSPGKGFRFTIPMGNDLSTGRGTQSLRHLPNPIGQGAPIGVRTPIPDRDLNLARFLLHVLVYQ